jgi:hypothetical protein
MRTQARQRPLMQKSGEIIRAIGQEFPSPEPDEEIEIFALDALGAGSCGGLRKRGMGGAERARVAAQSSEAVEQGSIRCAREQKRQQRVFPPARGIDLVHISRHAGMLVAGIRPDTVDAGRDIARKRPRRTNAQTVGR